MKKAVSVLMSLALAAGSFMCAPAFAAEQVTTDNVPSADYKFVDIAYDGKSTLVALAKDDTYASLKLYYSADNGSRWQSTANTPNGGSGALVAGSRESQQQLLWWGAKNKFVLHMAGNTYISEDGNNWKRTVPDAALHWTSNSVLDINGDWLVLCGNGDNGTGTVSATNIDTSSTIIKETNRFEFLSTSYYPRVIGVTSADEQGKRSVFVCGGNRSFDMSFMANENGVCTWTNGANNLGNVPMSPYDMVYNEATDSFLFVDGSKLYVAANTNNDGKYSQYVSNYAIGNANVTGVNANDSYIVVGMSDGTMYYTANEQITRETVWTPVPEMQSDEAIKNIEFIDDTNFVALGDTKIYKGSLIPGEEPEGPEVSVPVLGETTTSGDGYFAKTGTFTLTLTPNGTAGINVKVTAGDQVQTKTIDAALETEVKLGIIIVSDDESKLESITPSVKITGADAE